MTVQAGYLGEISVGPTPTVVALVRTWDYNKEGDEVDVSHIGTQDAEYVPGQIRATVTFTCVFDRDIAGDVGQNLMDAVGTEIDVNIYPHGQGTGKEHMSGTVIITGSDTTGSNDAGVEATYTARVKSGILTNVFLP